MLCHRSASAAHWASSSIPAIPTRALASPSTFRCEIAPPRLTRFVLSSNIARHNCDCSRSKTKSASRSATRSSHCNRTVQVWPRPRLRWILRRILGRRAEEVRFRCVNLDAGSATVQCPYPGSFEPGRGPATYEKSRVELDRATGLLLEHNGIDLADAQSGVVAKLPKVPYVTPSHSRPVAAARFAATSNHDSRSAQMPADRFVRPGPLLRGLGAFSFCFQYPRRLHDSDFPIRGASL